MIINRSKSKLIFSKGCSNKQELLQILGVSQGLLPMKYLGIPLYSAYPKPSDYSSLIDKCRMLTEEWIMKSLPFSGRAKLIKTILLNTLSYWRQSFNFPTNVIKELERISVNFLWKGRMHAWSRDSLWKPKCEGGLGITRISHLCKAAGIKLLWRLCSSHSSWSKWMIHQNLKSQPIALATSNYLIQNLEVHCGQ